MSKKSKAEMPPAAPPETEMQASAPPEPEGPAVMTLEEAEKTHPRFDVRAIPHLRFVEGERVYQLDVKRRGLYILRQIAE